jgi:hypothetical protein
VSLEAKRTGPRAVEDDATKGGKMSFYAISILMMKILKVEKVTKWFFSSFCRDHFVGVRIT